ncbi:MAG: zf-TFIIB domain-containing protein [Candidatus Brocadiaceae bacterium]|jgi:hypothetical protein
MQCLNCNREMINQTVLTREDQISYDTCEACGSLWLDAGELDKMAFQVEGSIEFSSRDRAGDSGAEGGACPRCEGVGLEAVRFLGASDIVLERCSNCGGVWLDGGELDLVNRELEEIMPVEGEGFSRFVNDVHLPIWHKRIRRTSRETDFRVDVPPVPGAERGGATDRACPVCGESLARYSAHGVDFEACPRCKGIWLDREELRALKDRSSGELWGSLRWLDDEVDAIESAHAVASGRDCPECEGAELRATTFGTSSVVLDVCPSCRGVWIDRGEFREILQYLKGQLEGMSPEEIREHFRQELREIAHGPEGPIGELRDALAALGALINVKILEHPKLAGLLSGPWPL